MCDTGDTRIVFLAILVCLTSIIAFVVYLHLYTSFSDWLALAALILSGVIVMERISSAIARILKEPHLRIVDSRREVRNEGSAGELMDLYLTIKNSGGTQAEDCNMQAEVKGVLTHPYRITPMPFSLNAGDRKEIHFQQIIKSEQKVRSLSNKSPTLNRGRIYEYEITFFGANFKDEKKHKLKLDLTSWDNLGVILDC